MHDVARLAGVSQSTVSRVLNQNSSSVPISEETRRKIQDVVKDLGYEPNMHARSLRTQRTQMIAVMIGDISNAFYHPIVRAIQDMARSKDYDVLISNSDHLHENEKRFLETVLRRPVDGIIMAPHRLNAEEIDWFVRRCKTPVVALGAQTEHPMVDVVGGTSRPATYEAISWLINERGHRRIGFIGTTGDMVPGPARLLGYQQAMSEARLPIESGFIQRADFTLEGGYQGMQGFLTQANPPTAIFAANSLMAVGAVMAAQDAGRDVPGEFSIMGFDDIPEATLIRPRLTTVTRDLPGLGHQVAEILFERISGQVTGPGRFFQSGWQIAPRESA
jgi:LacI family transcriptional regulator, galactose operon repressor